MASYSFAKYCDSGRLKKEIELSEIPKALDYITSVASPANTTCVFKEALSDVYQVTLQNIITTHVASPLAEVTPSPVVVQQAPAYGAKTITLSDGSIRKLFARNTGIQYACLIGDNNLDYTATYPWAKVLGVEVVGCENGDHADFYVYDTPTGTYSGYPNALLNQFAYDVNMPDGFYERVSRFDADLYAGMKIRIVYHSVSVKTVGINYIMDEVKA